MPERSIIIRWLPNNDNSRTKISQDELVKDKWVFINIELLRTYEHLLPLDILIANGRSDMKLACESFGSFCNLKKNNITSLVASENNHISKIISKYLLTTSVNYISLGTQCKPFENTIPLLHGMLKSPCPLSLKYNSTYHKCHIQLSRLCMITFKFSSPQPPTNNNKE